MRQQRWLELIKDYELEIHYHPGKANVVADALSRKSQVNMMVARPMPYELAKEFWEEAEGVVWFKERLCVPDIKLIRELVLKEAHETAYSIHPGSEKMYQDLKKRF